MCQHAWTKVIGYADPLKPVWPSSSTCTMLTRLSLLCVAGHPLQRRRTLLVIAHRIDTITTCDKVLVLSGGHLIESGAPAELARRPDGAFARLAAAAGASPP